jgi:hypothetical protein
MWSASTPAYAIWHKEAWGAATTWDTLAGSADWNIPDWARAPAAARFRLRNSAEDVGEMTEFRQSILGPGLTWLERVSTWEGAAEHLLKERWLFVRAADFLLIAGQRDRARAALLEGIETFQRQGRPDNFNELPGLHARMARYFPDTPTT